MRSFLSIVLVVSSPLPLASGLLVPPQVLYESDRVLAIDKSPGISHHNDEYGELGILNIVRQHHKDQRLYGVHRLDRVTSGILLLAKDAEMAGILTGAFRDKQAVKYYVGISNKKPKKRKQGWIKGHMARGRRKSWYLTKDATDADSSTYAVTRFFTAGLGGLDQSILPTSEQTPSTCILFRPHTGKTHQLRVAAKSEGLPLLGDPIYGDAKSSRTFLHAAGIHMPPLGGHEPISIWCPPPFAQHLWEESAQSQFEQVLDILLQKHCKCPEILCKKQHQQESQSH